MGLENDDVDDANEDVDDANDDVDDANDDVDGDETDNQPGLWLVPMLRCHPEHVSLSPVTNIEAMQLLVQCIFSARSSVAVTIAQIEATSTIQCNVMVTPRSCKTLV